MIYLRSTTYGLGVMASFTLFGFYSATYGPIELWLSHTPSTLLDKQSTFGGRRYGSLFLETKKKISLISNHLKGLNYALGVYINNFIVEKFGSTLFT